MQDKVRTVLLALLVVVSGLAYAQERANFLAVNGSLVSAAGPYYFIAQGDRRDAFAKADAIAKAMGLQVGLDAKADTLTFSSGGTQAVFDTTTDVRRGLVKRSGMLKVNGRSVASPMAIVVNGEAYVAVTPLVAAFGGTSPWNATNHVITIETPKRAGYALPPPRTGRHHGFSRVAITLPGAATYQLAAAGRTFVVTFPQAHAQPRSETLHDPGLAALTVRSGSGAATLVVRTTYALDPAGKGYRVGVLKPSAGTQVLYVDFAPGLHGRAVQAAGARGASAPVAASGTAGKPAPSAAAAAPTAPPALADPTPQQPVVVLDPGHGGMDPGASSPWAVEKMVVLHVALKLKTLLEQHHVKVIMTRDNDTFLTLAKRSTFETPQRNLFVSIHANAAPERSAHGIETWVFGKPLKPSYIQLAIRENGSGKKGLQRTYKARAAADALAGQILRQTQLSLSLTLAHDVQRQLIADTGAVDRGVRENWFYVLRTARIPSILVEVGFVTNPTEGRKLATARYQEKLAQGIAAGILEFLNGNALLAQY